MSGPIYLDCAATTPLEPEVSKVLLHYCETEFGNAGSRTHEYGARAKQAVQVARDQVSSVVNAKRDEVVFTSGATEANNLAILGLARSGHQTGKRHLVTSSIEHKAVLEPMALLARRGFEITHVPVSAGGRLDADLVRQAVRDDTLLVSIMAANNETGIVQPIDEICDALADSHVFLHVDAAQAFGKIIDPLRNRRIDLLSVSGHKIFGPKGIGALIVRRRGYRKIPLEPLLVGGGQERGLRPGTLPVPLVAAFGKAAEMALKNEADRVARCQEIRRDVIGALSPLNPSFSGNQEFAMPHILNLSLRGMDSEALIVGLKDLIAISNGSACTSASYQPSHVLKAMGMSDDEANSCVRISWCHLTPNVDWNSVSARLESLR